MTIDHVIPRSRGGLTKWNNVVAACHTCNRKKGNRLLEQIGMRLLRRPKRPAWKDLIHEIHNDAADEWLPYLDYAG